MYVFNVCYVYVYMFPCLSFCFAEFFFKIVEQLGMASFRFRFNLSFFILLELRVFHFLVVVCLFKMLSFKFISCFVL